MNFGKWEVNITSGMPQKIATAVAGLNDRFGCEYEPIVYIGSQQVNGILHAVLVKQKVVLGEDQVNVNLVKFLETKDGVAEISNESIIMGGSPLGGVRVDPKFGEDIPEEAGYALDKAFNGYVGSKVTAVALLSMQVVNGVDYVFLAEVESLTKESSKAAFLVKVNSLEQKPGFVNILATKEDVADKGVLGYAFTW